jgi:methionyl-tRNA formyltransferase
MNREEGISKTTCGLLASGGLGFTLLKQLVVETKLNFVLTDVGSEDIRKFCRSNAVPVFIGNPRIGNITEFLSGFDTEIILSVNYLFIVGKDVLHGANDLECLI